MDNMSRVPKELKKKMEENKLKAVTRSPDVNELVAVAKDVLSGQAKKEDLKERIDYMDTFIKNMEKLYEIFSPTQRRTPVSEEALPKIKEYLEDMNDSLHLFREYLDTDDPDTLEDAIEDIISITNSLFEVIDKLQKDEAEVKREYCDSAMLNELLRIAKGVADGLYPKETLEQRLKFVGNYINQTYESIKMFTEKKLIELDEIMEEAPLIIETLEELKEGLGELKAFLQDNDPSHIDESIEIIVKAAKELANSHKVIQSALAKANEEDKKKESRPPVCLKCGETLQIGVKICPKCHTPVVKIETGEVEMPEKTLEISERQEQLFSVTPMMTPNIVKIYNVVKQFLKVEVDETEVLKVLNWYENLIEQNKSKLAAEKIPQFKDDKEKEFFEAARKLLEEGLRDSEEGVKMLKEALPTRDINKIEQIMLKLIEGGEKLHQVQVIAKKIATAKTEK